MHFSTLLAAYMAVAALAADEGSKDILVFNGRNCSSATSTDVRIVTLNGGGCTNFDPGVVSVADTFHTLEFSCELFTSPNCQNACDGSTATPLRSSFVCDDFSEFCGTLVSASCGPISSMAAPIP